MMAKLVILTIFKNVILRMAIIVQHGMELIWLQHHIAYLWIILIATQIQEVFAIIQETHQLGVIFRTTHIIVNQ